MSLHSAPTATPTLPYEEFLAAKAQLAPATGFLEVGPDDVHPALKTQGLPEDVWTFCDHGHRVYVARNNPSGIALWGVPNDPVCAAGAR